MSSPFFFSSLYDAYHSFTKDPLSPLSYNPAPRLRLFNDNRTLRVQIKSSNAEFRLRLLGQVNSKSRLSQNMNLLEDEQLNNANLAKFKPRIGLDIPGDHVKFEDISYANTMRTQPKVLHNAERQLLNLTGGLRNKGSVTNTWGDISNPSCAKNAPQFWVSISGPSIFDPSTFQQDTDKDLTDDHFFVGENAAATADEDDEDDEINPDSLAAWFDPGNHFEHITNKNSIMLNSVNPFHDEHGQPIRQDQLQFVLTEGTYIAAEVVFNMFHFNPSGRDSKRVFNLLITHLQVLSDKFEPPRIHHSLSPVPPSSPLHRTVSSSSTLSTTASPSTSPAFVATDLEEADAHSQGKRSLDDSTNDQIDFMDVTDDNLSGPSVVVNTRSKRNKKNTEVDVKGKAKGAYYSFT